MHSPFTHNILLPPPSSTACQPPASACWPRSHSKLPRAGRPLPRAGRPLPHAGRVQPPRHHWPLPHVGCSPLLTGLGCRATTAHFRTPPISRATATLLAHHRRCLLRSRTPSIPGPSILRAPTPRHASPSAASDAVPSAAPSVLPFTVPDAGHLHRPPCPPSSCQAHQAPPPVGRHAHQAPPPSTTLATAPMPGLAQPVVGRTQLPAAPDPYITPFDRCSAATPPPSGRHPALAPPPSSRVACPR
jgi:hypothetical protein